MKGTASDMTAPASEWQIVSQTRDKLGESVLWHPREQALYWIDFYGPTVHRRDLVTGQQRDWIIAGHEFDRLGRVLR